MSVKKLKNDFLSSLDDQDKQDILNFLLESQVIEYGITYLLTTLPYLNGPKLEDISEKTLGQLINEMEKTKDDRLTDLIQKTREFNELRKEIVHNLIHLPNSKNEVLSSIRTQLDKAEDIKYEIDWHFNWIYENLLNIPYGSIF